MRICLVLVFAQCFFLCVTRSAANLDPHDLTEIDYNTDSEENETFHDSHNWDILDFHRQINRSHVNWASHEDENDYTDIDEDAASLHPGLILEWPEDETSISAAILSHPSTPEWIFQTHATSIPETTRSDLSQQLIFPEYVSSVAGFEGIHSLNLQRNSAYFDRRTISRSVIFASSYINPASSIDVLSHFIQFELVISTSMVSDLAHNPATIDALPRPIPSELVTPTPTSTQIPTLYDSFRSSIHSTGSVVSTELSPSILTTSRFGHLPAGPSAIFGTANFFSGPPEFYHRISIAPTEYVYTTTVGDHRASIVVERVEPTTIINHRASIVVELVEPTAVIDPRASTAVEPVEPTAIIDHRTSTAAEFVEPTTIIDYRASTTVELVEPTAILDHRTSTAVEFVEPTTVIELAEPRRSAIEDIEPSLAVEHAEPTTVIEIVESRRTATEHDESPIPTAYVEQTTDLAQLTMAIEQSESITATEYVEASIAMEHVELSTTIEHVEPSTTIEHVEPSTTLELVEPSITLEHVEPSTLEHVEPSITLEHIEPSTTLEHVEPSTTTEHAEPSTTLEHVQPSTTIRHVEPLTIIEHLEPSTTLEHVESSVTLEHFEPSTTIEHAESLTAIEHVEPSTTIEHVEPSTAIEHTEPTITIEHAETSIAIEHAEPSTAIEHAETSTAAEHVELSTSMEHVELWHSTHTTPLGTLAESESPTIQSSLQISVPAYLDPSGGFDLSRDLPSAASAADVVLTSPRSSLAILPMSDSGQSESSDLSAMELSRTSAVKHSSADMTLTLVNTLASGTTANDLHVMTSTFDLSESSFSFTPSHVDAELSSLAASTVDVTSLLNASEIRLVSTLSSLSTITDALSPSMDIIIPLSSSSSSSSSSVPYLAAASSYDMSHTHAVLTSPSLHDIASGELTSAYISNQYAFSTLHTQDITISFSYDTPSVSHSLDILSLSDTVLVSAYDTLSKARYADTWIPGVIHTSGFVTVSSYDIVHTSEFGENLDYDVLHTSEFVTSPGYPSQHTSQFITSPSYPSQHTSQFVTSSTYPSIRTLEFVTFPSYHSLHTSAFVTSPSYPSPRTSEFVTFPSYHSLHTSAFVTSHSYSSLRTSEFVTASRYHSLSTSEFVTAPIYHSMSTSEFVTAPSYRSLHTSEDFDTSTRYPPEGNDTSRYMLHSVEDTSTSVYEVIWTEPSPSTSSGDSDSHSLLYTSVSRSRDSEHRMTSEAEVTPSEDIPEVYASLHTSSALSASPTTRTPPPTQHDLLSNTILLTANWESARSYEIIASVVSILTTTIAELTFAAGEESVTVVPSTKLGESRENISSEVINSFVETSFLVSSSIPELSTSLQTDIATSFASFPVTETMSVITTATKTAETTTPETTTTLITTRNATNVTTAANATTETATTSTTITTTTNFTTSTDSVLAVISNFSVAVFFDGDCEKASEKRYVGILTAKMHHFIRNVSHIEHASRITVGRIKCNPKHIPVTFIQVDRVQVMLHLNNTFSKLPRYLNIHSIILNLTGFTEELGFLRKTSDSELTPVDIAVFATASFISVALIIAGLVICAREIRRKKSSNRLPCPNALTIPTKSETLALTGIPAPNSENKLVEMNEERFVNEGYTNPDEEEEYATVVREQKTRFPSSAESYTPDQDRNDTNLNIASGEDARDATKPAVAVSTDQRNSTSGQESPGYGLIIGLMGYTKKLERQQQRKHQRKHPQQQQALQLHESIFYAVPQKGPKPNQDNTRANAPPARDSHSPPSRYVFVDDSPSPPLRLLKTVPEVNESNEELLPFTSELVTGSSSAGRSITNRGLDNPSFSRDSLTDVFHF